MGKRLKGAAGLGTGFLSFIYLIFVLNPIQMVSAVVYPFSASLCRRMNRWCAQSIWGIWVIMAEVQNGIRIRFTGDNIPKKENAIIIANHQSMADIMVLLCFAWRCGRLGDMKWFVKDMLKYVPGVGWGMKFLDCVFVKRNWAEDKSEISRLFGKYNAEEIPIFLVSFLEGSRVTPDKLAKAQAFAKEKNTYVPQHTLVPRTKGFVASLQGLRGHVEVVYDLTLGYADRVPGLLDCFLARPDRIEVHVRRYPVEELPTDEAAMSQWAFQRYEEKDALMAHFQKEQSFPGECPIGLQQGPNRFRQKPGREPLYH